MRGAVHAHPPPGSGHPMAIVYDTAAALGEGGGRRGRARSTTPAYHAPPPAFLCVDYRGKGQGKGKGRGEGRLGQGGRGRSKGGEKLMGTTAYGGKGSKGRAANGDRPVGAASCRRDHHTMASCQSPPPL